MTGLTLANRNLELARIQLQADLDDVSGEAKSSEEKARRACDDAARIAEELRQEQAHSACEEQSGRTMGALVVQLQNRLAACENGSQREDKRRVQSFEARVSGLGDKCFPACFFSQRHIQKTKSEKTNKHTIRLIYPKKRYEHTLF